MTTKIGKPTPEQEALIPVYREKWRAIALSTERIDRQKVREIVNLLYTFLEKETPEILWLDSPYAFLRYAELENLTGNTLTNKIFRQLSILPTQLIEQLTDELWERLSEELNAQLEDQLELQFNEHLLMKLHEEVDLYFQKFKDKINFRVIGKLLNQCIYPERWAYCNSVYEFCILVLNCLYDPDQWNIHRLLAEQCGWLVPFQKVCIVCDRPTKIFFDSENCLHAEGEPAIQFADGFSVYAHHGELLYS
ncbi:MAG: hypothetical protein KME12_14170 [Trichocoleus desertorum ATA4-8-CV12]|jgi:hypothetical protein|nr:hypothetical protein [Trichocoleus desertorum ATA4-8-CV12]